MTEFIAQAIAWLAVLFALRSGLRYLVLAVRSAGGGSAEPRRRIRRK